MTERVWLWLVVHLGTRRASPRQFRRFYLLMSIGWFLASLAGGYALVRGDHAAGLFVAITLIVMCVSVAFTCIAAADLRGPRTIEGRVTAVKEVAGKGRRTSGGTYRYRDEHGYYSHRVTIEDTSGAVRTFRGTLTGLSGISPGVLVRARVGMRLRWVYQISAFTVSGPGRQETAWPRQA